MSSLTLGQASDALRGLAKVIREHGTCAPMAVEHVAEAIDAHIAGMGEPVAWLAADGSGRVIDVKAKSAGARASATASATSVYSIPIYAAPPIDIAAVRTSIANLRTWHDEGADAIADDLEAAIKGGA